MAPCPYNDYAPATISFCEARVCDWVVEPSNAWSNLGYVIIGLAVLAKARGRAVQWLIGVASILIGIGSFGLHGTGTRVGELADVGAMYLMSALGAVVSLQRLFALSASALVGTYVVMVLGSIGLMVGLRNNGIFMFAGQLLFAIFAEIHLYRRGVRVPSYGQQKLMLVSFFTAFFIWNLDKWNILCRPDNHLITGHAVWHALTALSIWFFARQQDQPA